MTQQNDHSSVFTTEKDAPSVSEAIMMNIISLRKVICDAWQERAITFTPEEQRRLKAEIAETASLFNDLIRSS